MAVGKDEDNTMKTRRLKSVGIIAIWLVFLVIVDIALFKVEYHFYEETALENLQDFAATVSAEMSLFARDEYFAEYSWPAWNMPS